MDVLIDFDDLRDYFFNLNKFGYLDKFLFDSFYLIDLW